jgi:hypothetical protein
MWKAFWQQDKAPRSGSKRLICTFDLKLPFENIESLVLKVMNVGRCASMRRHNSLRESEVPLGVFPACFIRKLDAVHVHLLPFPQRKDFRLTYKGIGGSRNAAITVLKSIRATDIVPIQVSRNISSNPRPPVPGARAFLQSSWSAHLLLLLFHFSFFRCATGIRVVVTMV